MTETSYQEARKVMQKANLLRGKITACKAEVAKWTAFEDSHKQNMQPGKAESSHKMLLKALKKLEEAKHNFAILDLPPSNMTMPYHPNHCKICGSRIAHGISYCGECISED